MKKLYFVLLLSFLLSSTAETVVGNRDFEFYNKSKKNVKIEYGHTIFIRKIWVRSARSGSHKKKKSTILQNKKAIDPSVGHFELHIYDSSPTEKPTHSYKIKVFLSTDKYLFTYRPEGKKIKGKRYYLYPQTGRFWGLGKSETGKSLKGNVKIKDIIPINKIGLAEQNKIREQQQEEVEKAYQKQEESRKKQRERHWKRYREQQPKQQSKYYEEEKRKQELLETVEKLERYASILELQVDELSTTRVKKAYRTLSFKYHPDRAPVGQKEEYKETMKRINDAYTRLTNYLKEKEKSEGEEERPVSKKSFVVPDDDID